MDSNRENDIGQQLTELEQSNAHVAYTQYVKERRAVEADLYARIHAASRAELDDVTAECQGVLAAWIMANKVPHAYPPRRSAKVTPLTSATNGRVIELFADRQAG